MSFVLALFLACCLLAAPPDSAIERSLRARLARSKLAQDKVQYVVRNGAVEWTGQVSVPQRKGAATRMAKAAGATQVRNHIRVAAAPRATAAAPRRVTVVVPPR